MWRNWVPRQNPHLVPTMHNDIHSDYGERAQSKSALPDTRLLDRCWIVYLLAVCEPTSKGPVKCDYPNESCFFRARARIEVCGSCFSAAKEASEKPVLPPLRGWSCRVSVTAPW